LVLEDRKIRDFIKNDPDFKGAGIAGVDIKRAAQKLTIKIHTSRPGMVIGQKGKKIEDLRRRLEKMVGRDLIIDVQEVRKPEINAQLVAENIALQLARASKSGSKAAWPGPKSPGRSGTGKAGCRCTRSGLTSTTVLPRPGPLTGSSGSRPGSSTGRCWAPKRRGFSFEFQVSS